MAGSEIGRHMGKKKRTRSHRPVLIEVPPVDVRHNGVIEYTVVIGC